VAVVVQVHPEISIAHAELAIKPLASKTEGRRNQCLQGTSKYVYFSAACRKLKPELEQAATCLLVLTQFALYLAVFS
jgi:hypothetical protein